MVFVKSALAGLATFVFLVALIIGAAFLAPLVMERAPFPAAGATGATGSVYWNTGWVVFPIWPVVAPYFSYPLLSLI